MTNIRCLKIVWINLTSNRGCNVISSQPLTGIKPIQGRKLVDEVLDQLQALIQSGQYRSGEKLPPEPELMKLLSVGRSTVREAVKILVHAGLLEVRQGDGTYVRSMSGAMATLQTALIPQNDGQMLEMRRILEIEAAGLAALRRTEHDLQAMRESLDRRSEALRDGKYSAYVEADIAFHLAVAEASHNDVFLAFYKMIASGLRELLSQLILDTSRYQDNTIYHEAIYMAIKAGDSEGAKKYTVQNLDTVAAATHKQADRDNK